MSASGPPLCRICQKEHWMRDPHILPANAKGEVRSTNTRREGRDVLKAKATSTKRDHRKSQPASRLRKHGSDGIAAKPKTAAKTST